MYFVLFGLLHYVTELNIGHFKKRWSIYLKVSRIQNISIFVQQIKLIVRLVCIIFFIAGPLLLAHTITLGQFVQQITR